MSKKNSWLTRFHETAAELQEYPRVAVTNLWVGDPVSDEEITRVEEELGFALDDALKNFYRQANGVQLRWMDRESEHFNQDNYPGIDNERSEYLRGDWDSATGIIDILPIRQALLDEADEFDYYDTGEFDRPIRPFDLFSALNSAGILLDEQTPGLTIRIGDDNDATFDESLEINLNTYLESILRHRGMTNPRLGEFFSGRMYDEFAELVIPADQPRPPLTHYFPLPQKKARATKQAKQTGPIRVRVPHDAGGSFSHGIALDKKFKAPHAPSDWSSATDFIKVAFDSGEVCYVRSRKVKTLTEPTVYERARADINAFLQDLLAAPPEQRAITLLKIAGFSSTSSLYVLHTEHGTEDFIINRHVPRYLTLLNSLEKPAAMQWLLTLIDSFAGVDLSATFDFPIDSTEVFNPKDYGSAYKGRYTNLLELLLQTMAQLLMQQFHETPFKNVRERFGDAFADKLSHALTAFGEFCPMQAFLLQAIDALPGSYDANEDHGNPLYSDYLSDQFGIEGEPLPML